MGFLKIFGHPIEWEESKKYFHIIKKDALEKIIYWIKTVKEEIHSPKFGYEVDFFNKSIG